MKRMLSGRVVLGMVVIAALLMVVTLWIIISTAPASLGTRLPPRAIMTIIPPPTSTPTSLYSSQSLLTSTPVDTPTPYPGGFSIGVFVQITGTGGEGLHLRSDPSLSASPLFLGYDSEAYQVVDGPASGDGHTWWKLTAPYDSSRTGWAVQDYLTVITSH